MRCIHAPPTPGHKFPSVHLRGRDWRRLEDHFLGRHLIEPLALLRQVLRRVKRLERKRLPGRRHRGLDREGMFQLQGNEVLLLLNRGRVQDFRNLCWLYLNYLTT